VCAEQLFSSVYRTWDFEPYQYLTVKHGDSGLAVLPDKNEW
jgi:hypothetical protein